MVDRTEFVPGRSQAAYPLGIGPAWRQLVCMSNRVIGGMFGREARILPGPLSGSPHIAVTEHI